MQTKLFKDTEPEKENSSQKKERDNEFEWNQFIRLGDMMGDELHHEPDGKWITREYKRLSKILIPEIAEAYKEKRKRKAASTNEQIKKLIEKFKCSCGGELKQKRSGTKVVYCIICDKRYVATTKKKRTE